MPPTPSSENPLPPSWTDVLTQVDQAIRQAEETAAEREQVFAVVAPADVADAREAKWQQCLARLHQRFAALEACAARAVQNAGVADNALESVEHIFRQWLAESQTVTQKLADQGTSEVE